MSNSLSQGKYHGKDHPLVAAIELRNKALQNDANQKIIRNIEHRISIECERSIEIFGGDTLAVSKLANEVTKQLHH